MHGGEDLWWNVTVTQLQLILLIWISRNIMGYKRPSSFVVLYYIQLHKSILQIILVVFCRNSVELCYVQLKSIFDCTAVCTLAFYISAFIQYLFIKQIFKGCVKLLSESSEFNLFFYQTSIAVPSDWKYWG